MKPHQRLNPDKPAWRGRSCRTGSRHVWPLFAMLLPIAAPVFSSVPAFSGTDLNGDVHALNDYAGKMVVVNYWATWCPPCLEELPELTIFHDAHEDEDAVVLGVNFEVIARDRLLRFLDEQMIDYPVLSAPPGPRTPFGRLTGLPTTYLVAPDRKSMRVHVGPLTRKHLEDYLQHFQADAK